MLRECKRTLRIGARKSLLSRIQVSLVAKSLANLWPQLNFIFSFHDSFGDKNPELLFWNKNSSSSPVFSEEAGVFSTALSRLLLSNKLDILVHSFKDLPIKDLSSEKISQETEFVPVLDRGDQRDILLMKREVLVSPPTEVIILASAPRRILLAGNFLKQALPSTLQKSKLVFNPIRGNVPSRLKKLNNSEAHGIILAKAGLDRLLIKPSSLFFDPTLLQSSELKQSQKEIYKIIRNYEFMILPLSSVPNAAAQGSIALEIKNADLELKSLITPLCIPSNTSTSLEEREELSKKSGSCYDKIGIAVLERDYGRLYFIKGRDNAGKKISYKKIQNKVDANSVKTKLWPLKGEGIVIKRHPISSALPKYPPQYCLVSRSNAWPDKWKPKSSLVNCASLLHRIIFARRRHSIIWTAGTKTLFALAKQGLWVHGSADGLGEDEAPQLNYILKTTPGNTLKNTLRFTKLSHQDNLLQSAHPCLPSYKIELIALLPLIGTTPLSSRTHFFWKSASQFNWMLKKYPDLANAKHACGPGLTRKVIQETINLEPKIYLDYQSYLEEMLEEMQ